MLLQAINCINSPQLPPLPATYQLDLLLIHFITLLPFVLLLQFSVKHGALVFTIPTLAHTIPTGRQKQQQQQQPKTKRQKLKKIPALARSTDHLLC